MYVFGWYVNILELLLVFNVLLILIVVFETLRVRSLRKLVDDLTRVDRDLRKVDEDLSKRRK